MLRFVGRRFAALVPTLILATMIVFGLMKLIPGDPATVIVGEYASQERIEEIREQLNLNDPVPVQYVRWATDAVQGDLGSSLHTDQPVIEAIQARLPATIQIVVAAMLLSALVGIPLGFMAGWRPDTAVDSFARGASTVGIGIPNFWLGMVLVTIFALTLDWLPAIGFSGITSGLSESARYLILPAVALGAASVAEMTRQTRSAVLEVRSNEFVRTLRAAGLSTRTVLKHVVKNAGIPMVTVLGLQASRLLGATVVVEAVFGIPGAGSLVVEAVARRDYPIVQGVVLVMALLVLAVNFLVDLSYRVIDPRIRL